MIKDANVYFDEIYHKYVFAYRKYHGCDSALLSLTEQWKKEIDNNYSHQGSFRTMVNFSMLRDSKPLGF